MELPDILSDEEMQKLQGEGAAGLPDVLSDEEMLKLQAEDVPVGKVSIGGQVLNPEPELEEASLAVAVPARAGIGAVAGFLKATGEGGWSALEMAYDSLADLSKDKGEVAKAAYWNLRDVLGVDKPEVPSGEGAEKVLQGREIGIQEKAFAKLAEFSRQNADEAERMVGGLDRAGQEFGGGAAGDFAQMAGGAVGSTLPYVAFAPAGLGAAAVGGGVLQAGQGYRDADGTLPKDQAKGYAVIQGAITAGVTAAGGKTGPEALLGLAQSLKFRTALVEYGKQGGAEGVEELVEGFLQDLVTRETGVEELSNRDIAERAVFNFGAGMALGIGFKGFADLSLALEKRGQKGEPVDRVDEAPGLQRLRDALSDRSGPGPAFAPSNPSAPGAGATIEAPSNPSAPAKWKGPKLPSNPEGYDVLDFIQENGGLKNPGREPAAEWDDAPKLSGVYRSALLGGVMAPDQLAQIGQERGFGDGTVGGFWAEVNSAIEWRVKRTAEVKQVVVDAKDSDQLVKRQGMRFESSMLKQVAGRLPVSAAEVVVGDRLLSGDEVAVVVDVDPDTMQITLDGGERMGMRVIPGDTTLYINAVESAPVSDPEMVEAFDGDAGGTGQNVNKGVGSGNASAKPNFLAKLESEAQRRRDPVSESILRARAATQGESPEAYLRSSLEAIRGVETSGVDPVDPVELQRQLLIRWAEVNGFLKLPSGMPQQAGAEHGVYISPGDTSFVIKATLTHQFGARFVEEGGQTVMQYLTPLQYLDRLRLTNEVFGDDLEFLGVTRDGRILTRQRYIMAFDTSKPHPKQAEVDEYMREAGFREVQESKGWKWYRPRDGTFISDARADNFIQAIDGPKPVDLSVWRPREEQAAKGLEDQVAAEAVAVEVNPPFNAAAPLVYQDKGDPYVQVELKGMEHVHIVAMPELVELVRVLTGNVPMLKKFQSARGAFYGIGRGMIKLDPRIFVDPISAAKTLAHEIGHLVDYLPDLTMLRGNLLGRLGTLRKHLSTTLPDLPDNPSKALTPKDRARLRYLALKTVTEKHGNRPSSDEPEDLEMWNENVRDEYGRLVEDEIKTRGLLREAEIREELVGLTEYWKPIPEGSSASYLAYRLSGVELYADALSVLLNSPATLKDKAPVFYKTFFGYLDRKPEVKEALLAVQELLQKPAGALMASRSERMRGAFLKGDEIFRAKWAEVRARALSWKGLLAGLKTELHNIYAPIIRKQRQVEATGITLNVKERLDWFFDAHPLGDNQVYLFLTKVQTDVINGLQELDLDRKTLGEFLYFTRVANESYDIKVEGALGVEEGGRKNLANPGGHTAGTATTQLLGMRRQLGALRWEALEAAAKRMHDQVFLIMKDAAAAGLISRELFEDVIAPNRDFYAAFVPLKYWDTYVPAGIKAQTGTFSDIANPFEATLLKSIALMKAAQIQRAKMMIRDFLVKYFPGEIQAAEMVGDGKGMRARIPKEKGKALLELKKDGKLESWVVEEDIARAFDRISPEQMFTSIRMMSLVFRSYIYPLIIRFNPSFQLVTSPIRDFRRLMVNAPPGSRAKMTKEYFANFYKFLVNSPDSMVRKRLGKFGEGPGLKRPGVGASMEEVYAWKLNMEMLNVAAIWSPFDSFARSVSDVDGFDMILQQFHLAPEAEKTSVFNTAILKPISQFFLRIEFAGQMFEALPKMTAYKVLTKDLGWSEPKSAMYVRNHIGVPNFTKRGRFAWVANSFLPFFTVFQNGWESDIKLASGKVKGNSSGYWWMSWMLFGGGMYMLMQTLAEEGALGEELRNWFAGTSKYDREQNLIIPAGFTPGGEYGQKVVYFRVPQDETARTINGVMRYAIKGAFAAARGESVAGDVYDGIRFSSGQIPSINPILKLIGGWKTFLGGQNPVDDFRGGYILNRSEQMLRDGSAWTTMAAWSLDQTGATNFVKFNSQADSFTEFTASAVPGLNRVLRITDSGYRSRQFDSENEADKENRKIRAAMPKDVQRLVVEYDRLTSLRRDNRTVDQQLRLSELSLWYKAYYLPGRDFIAESDDAAKKSQVREMIRSGSSAFIKP